MKSKIAIVVALGLAAVGAAGTVAPAQAATPQTVRPNSGTVVGIEYWDANNQGATYTFTGNTCTATLSDVDNWVSAIGSGWDNKISSFRSFANCDTKLWENTNFWGSSYGWVGDTSYVGNAMNDQASSIQWS